MKIYSIIILHVALMALCWLPSCVRSGYGNEEMNAAEELMESRPDSAYEILKNLDCNHLRCGRQQARYALLMSMALDKNYIDTTSFTVLQPAIDYYLKNGSADEQLKTYYYQGVIYSNRGNFEKALESYAKGLRHYANGGNSLTAARLLVAQGILLANYYDYQSATECYFKAANIYDSLDMDDMRLDCLLYALNGCVVTNDKNVADSILSVCSKIECADSGRLLKMERGILAYHVNFSGTEKIKDIISGRKEMEPANSYYIIDLALAHHKIGDNERALELLSMLDENNMDYDTLKYESVKVLVYKDKGDFKNALRSFYKLSDREFVQNETKFNQKMRLIEERLNQEFITLKESEKKTRIIWIGMCCFLMLLSITITLIFITRNQKSKKELALQKVYMRELEANNLARQNRTLEQERDKSALEAHNLAKQNKALELERNHRIMEMEDLMDKIVDLENESDRLKTLMDAPKKFPEEVQQAIKIRIEMLNDLMALHITKNDKYGQPYKEWINELTANKQTFLNSNRLAFSASHPVFIDYLERQGLTLDEINYVCLYALGLRSKEVGVYMQRPSHVNTSSQIRKKLGLDIHSTNLGIYIRKLLKGEIPEV